MLLTKRYNLNDLPFAVLVFFTLTFFIYNDFNIRMIIGYGILLACLFCNILFMDYKVKVTKNKLLSLILFISIAVNVLSPSSRLEQDSFYLLITVFISGAFIFFGSLNSDNFRRISKLIIRFATILAVYVIIVRIWPDFYYIYVSSHISSESQRVVSTLLQTGYGVAIGGDVVLLDYILMLACFIQVSKINITKDINPAKRVDFFIVVLFLIAILLENRKSELFATIITLTFLFLKNKSIKEVYLFFIKTIVGILMVGVPLFFIAETFNIDYQSVFTRYVNFFDLLAKWLFSNQGMEADFTSGRIDLWTRAVKLFLDSPILGIGWGNFANNISFTFNNLNDGQLHNVHNNYLQILCENGLIGFVSIIVPVFLIFNNTLKREKDFRHLKTDPDTHVAVLASLAYQFCFLLISFIDPCIYKMIFWSFYAIVLMMADTKCSVPLQGVV